MSYAYENLRNKLGETFGFKLKDPGEVLGRKINFVFSAAGNIVTKRRAALNNITTMKTMGEFSRELFKLRNVNIVVIDYHFTTDTVVMRVTRFLTLLAAAVHAHPQPPLQTSSDVSQGTLPERCDAVPDVGPCKGYVYKWYFNSNVSQCLTFVYGGCSSNGVGNIFDSEAECLHFCLGENGEYSFFLTGPTEVQINNDYIMKKLRKPCKISVRIADPKD
ncbi:hypothetical protein ANN_01057 [Periplaneta americana]|uniref:BPTI/Kunitz inhibitor domain-containing protein n=1 Tax=Periplaneta americana TaxID=6978 RepID=A0ABQ8TSI5_PERAM|nr:hypothetical protein ANN_01057 [Periplaneta americana]